MRGLGLRTDIVVVMVEAESTQGGWVAMAASGVIFAVRFTRLGIGNEAGHVWIDGLGAHGIGDVLKGSSWSASDDRIVEVMKEIEACAECRSIGCDEEPLVVVVRTGAAVRNLGGARNVNGPVLVDGGQGQFVNRIGDNKIT